MECARISGSSHWNARSACWNKTPLHLAEEAAIGTGVKISASVSGVARGLLDTPLRGGVLPLHFPDGRAKLPQRDLGATRKSRALYEWRVMQTEQHFGRDGDKPSTWIPKRHVVNRG